MGGWKRVASGIVQIGGGAVLFKDYIGEVAFCSGDSMLPTLRSAGDILYVDKTSIFVQNIRTGDVVVCASPSDPDRLICKRVMGTVSKP